MGPFFETLLGTLNLDEEELELEEDLDLELLDEFEEELPLLELPPLSPLVAVPPFAIVPPPKPSSYPKAENTSQMASIKNSAS